MKFDTDVLIVEINVVFIEFCYAWFTRSNEY